MAESSYTDPKVIEASKMFVNVVAHRETTHGDREVQLGKDKVKLCKEYYTIPCDVHVKGNDAVNKFFQGNFGTPTTVFCDPTGKEISRKPGAMGAGELVKMMQETLGKVTGEKVPLASWKLVTDADAALEKGEFKKAIDGYTRAGKVKRLKETADAGLAKVGEKGEALLKEALENSDVEAKKKALKKIADDFKPLEVATKAKKELDGIR
jgi:hypothetical protein